ncbi:MAG: hypothetical protein KatS3mg124_1133 [Porticoccaceae bacterium]|nr:MAG: hypothetical protein KatS3mg124_1133 [Porticoccaceae bacterium]
MRRLCCLLGLLVALGAVAEEGEEELLGLYGSEDFLSIATGFRQPLAQAPAVATVIDEEQIRRLGARDLDEVLATVPGLHVSYNHQGYFPIYVFRGIYAGFNPQVLILVDGVPQTQLFTGGKNFVWGGFPAELIERVEIIRGPGSAIYGADASAGVINVITKGTNGPPARELGVEVGSFDSRGAFGHWREPLGTGEFYLGGRAWRTDGEGGRVARDAQSLLDALTGTNASQAPGEVRRGRTLLDLVVAARWGSLALKALYQGRRGVETGAGIAQALDPRGAFASDRLQLSANWVRALAPDLELRASGSFLATSQESERDALLFPPGTTGPSGMGFFPEGVIGNPEVWERHWRGGAVFHYTGLAGHDLALGLGFHEGEVYRTREEKNYCLDEASCAYLLPRLASERLVDVADTPFVFLAEGRRRNRYLYLQDVWDLAPDWQLTAGVRHDRYSDFGDTTNPRLALVWSVARELSAKLLYGRAFRAPSFGETRTFNNPANLGNPELDPERLESLELALDYRPRHDLELRLNAFRYSWDDIVLFVPDPGGGMATARNAGRQTGHGLEGELDWRPLRGFALRGNLAWQSSTNARTNQTAANAPRLQAYLEGTWRFRPGWSATLSALWVGERERDPGDPRKPLGAWLRCDLALRGEFSERGVEFTVRAANLFDEDLREPTPLGVPAPALPEDLPLAGRSLHLEVRLGLR